MINRRLDRDRSLDMPTVAGFLRGHVAQAKLAGQLLGRADAGLDRFVGNWSEQLEESVRLDPENLDLRFIGSVWLTRPASSA